MEEIASLKNKLSAVLTHALAEREELRQVLSRGGVGILKPNDMAAVDGPKCFCGQPSTMECGWCYGAELIDRAKRDGVDQVGLNKRKG